LISTDFPHANDTEYWLRILRGGGTFGYTGLTSCLYRKHPNAMSLRASRILTNTAQICERYGDWDAIPPSIGRRRAANLYRYAGRSTLSSDARAAVSLILRSLRIDPVRPPTWYYLAVAYFKMIGSKLV
jgi:hypothetical protein